MNRTTLFCIFGVISLAFGVFHLFRQLWLRKACTAQTRGDVSFLPYESGAAIQAQLMKLASVLSVITGLESFFAKLCTAAIHYEVITYSANGVEHVVPTGQYGVRDEFRYSMGQNIVTVAYDPANPARFIVLEKKGTIALGVMCVVIGAVFALVPLIPNE